MERCYILWMMRSVTEQDRPELGDDVSFYQIGERTFACSGYLTFLKRASGEEKKITNLVGTISQLYGEGWELIRQSIIDDPSTLLVFYFKRTMGNPVGC